MIRRQQEAGQRQQVMVAPTFILNDGAARVEEASEAKLFAALEAGRQAGDGQVSLTHFIPAWTRRPCSSQNSA